MKRRYLFGFLATAALTAVCAFTRCEPEKAPLAAAAIPVEWAPSVTIPGAGNCFRVTDRLYRSEQPDAAGMANLAGAGVTTVINLRANHDDRDEAAGTALKLIRVPIDTWKLEDADVIAVMRAIRAASGPVLIHCQHGADRTGTMVAMYRILYQNWTKEAALAEMTDARHGYHTVWGNLPKYVRNADVARLRAEIEKPAG